MPLYPRKRTCAVQDLMSALGHKRTLKNRSRKQKDRLAAVSLKSSQVFSIKRLRDASRLLALSRGGANLCTFETGRSIKALAYKLPAYL